MVVLEIIDLADHSDMISQAAVDAAKPNGELRSLWRFVGADEPNYAYMKDGKNLGGGYPGTTIHGR